MSESGIPVRIDNVDINLLDKQTRRMIRVYRKMCMYPSIFTKKEIQAVGGIWSMLREVIEPYFDGTALPKDELIEKEDQ